MILNVFNNFNANVEQLLLIISDNFKILMSISGLFMQIASVLSNLREIYT